MNTIRIADFAPSPGGRFAADGEYSGEWFRNEILAPAIRDAVASSQPLIIVMDGTSGYGSSFLEEAFGGLIRRRFFAPSIVRGTIKLHVDSPLYAPYKALAEKYIAAAKPETVAA